MGIFLTNKEWKMKLDKIKFARLIAMIASEYHYAHNDFIQSLDDLIDIEIPVQDATRVSQEAVNELLREIISPDGFIPAIKAYRSLTGAGLKEAKEAVEKYRAIPSYRHQEQ